MSLEKNIGNFQKKGDNGDQSLGDISQEILIDPHSVPSKAPMQSLFFILPTTEPSSAPKDPTTATTPWKPTTACAKEWPTIEWIHTRRWIIGGLETISIRSVASIGLSTKPSASTGHWTHSHWSCPIKSWHKNPSFHLPP
jgi:hypothetical protein